MSDAAQNLTLQVEQPGAEGWHTMIRFCEDQKAQIQEDAADLADITRRPMRILNGAGRVTCVYKPGFYKANPETPATWWQPA